MADLIFGGVACITVEQFTTVKVPVLLVDETDGGTPETGVAAPTIYLSKAGAAPAVPNDGTWAELDSTNMKGEYTVQLDDTDTNTVGLHALNVVKTGTTRHTRVYINVVPAQSPASVAALVNDAAATTTSFDTDLTEATNDHYNGAFLLFTSGALAGQGRMISDYVGATKVVTVDYAFTEAPADDDRFVITWLGLDVRPLLGLMHGNFKLKSTVYNAQGTMTSAVMRIYPTAADATADTNHIGEYTITGTADANGRLATYTCIKA